MKHLSKLVLSMALLFLGTRAAPVHAASSPTEGIGANEPESSELASSLTHLEDRPTPGAINDSSGAETLRNIDELSRRAGLERDREGYVKNLLDQVYQQYGRQHNVLIFNANNDYQKELQGEVLRRTERYNNEFFVVEVFDSGTYKIEKGDGGYINWAFTGCYDHDKGTPNVTFYPVASCPPKIHQKMLSAQADDAAKAAATPSSDEGREAQPKHLGRNQ